VAVNFLSQCLQVFWTPGELKNNPYGDRSTGKISIRGTQRKSATNV
jgi:hypothetical protein